MFTNYNSDAANYQNQLHTLAACDQELDRLRLASQDRMLLTMSGALAAIGRMQAVVTERRALLVQQGVLE